MAMTPEAKVKKIVRKQLDVIPKCYYFMPATGGYGKSGVPDIVGSYNGRFFGIELKAGNNQPTLLQQKNLYQIWISGGIAAVVNEDNMNDIEDILNEVEDASTQLELDL